jgi:hypothetical protein
MALREFLPLLNEKGCFIVQVYSDNTTAVHNINRKAASKSLAPSLRKLLVYAQNQGITLQALHIPGVENKVMDSLSRLKRAGDYKIQRKFFNRMIRKFYFFSTIDLFANKSNKLVRDYCAIRRPDPNHLEGYKGNAWDLHWSTLKAWLHPPIPLIMRVL